MLNLHRSSSVSNQHVPLNEVPGLNPVLLFSTWSFWFPSVFAWVRLLIRPQSFRPQTFRKRRNRVAKGTRKGSKAEAMSKIRNQNWCQPTNVPLYSVSISVKCRALLSILKEGGFLGPDALIFRAPPPSRLLQWSQPCWMQLQVNMWSAAARMHECSFGLSYTAASCAELEGLTGCPSAVVLWDGGVRWNRQGSVCFGAAFTPWTVGHQSRHQFRCTAPVWVSKKLC